MAKNKKRFIGGAAYRNAKENATNITGYDQNSPIWGLRLPEVLAMIEERVQAGENDAATEIIGQLKARLARQAVIRSWAK